ncbi:MULTISPECIES: YraN family protein [Methylobacterium]|uniref:UPF0102 protein AOPFMNJM_2568 n=1 Tax=Methylobacterium jeotgali TaxID=381630 RepID=A0ABQ4SVV2_9HYPH|nr:MULTISPECIES: YraN family protein [Methylobacterium]PIU05207.1 MAG: hypothetical protein COT56_16125 [Methylobacterium sp. CG09_land_8_20_14_0_10_71_15]PIU12019.1 MAG: hypothetical protein COT28_17065 [Methylobacterium sp. CG08_land_8_20_14_0_20_71_15]GBU16035.1 hypothetical protein AwMethylo_02500 [Methylobacterium sp.]GJE07242.1 hypothetical protein AOPFMNJM_2568 [Methylobacterium jeotgali]
MRPDRLPDRRRVTERRGRLAEWRALAALVLKGYRPLALRYAAAGGEVDLVMRRGGTLAFVEVKARPTLVSAQEAIGAAKRRGISRAARAYVSRHPWAAALVLRGDAVFVTGLSWPVHLPDAFPLDGL